MNIAERLQHLRNRENYSQEQLADLLEISRQSISKWESGQGKPEIDNIIKLAQIYDVTTDYILLGQEIKKSQYKQNELHSETRKTINIIAVIAAITVCVTLFISAMTLLS